MDFSWPLFVDSLSQLIAGARTTVEIVLAALVLALVLGVLIGLLRVSERAWVRRVTAAYIVFVRGMPLLVLLLFAYYALPSVGLSLEAVLVGVVVLGVNHAAYVSEAVRGGIESVDRGQTRAAFALGMSRRHTMTYVVLPQAARRILPPVTNEAINLLKNSALVSTIAVTELLRSGLEVMTFTANTFSPFIGVALIYLVMTLPLVALAHQLERRYGYAT
jgi:polar amino acid transport system permease protein